ASTTRPAALRSPSPSSARQSPRRSPSASRARTCCSAAPGFSASGNCREGGRVRGWDAIVVGAGPAGSTTALLLARTGVRVLLLDRARFPRHKACSEYSSPATPAVPARLVAGVVVRSGDGQRATRNASIVVGADGLHSVIARRLGLVRTSPPRRVAFTAHVADVAGVDGVGELHVGADGYVGLGPIGGGVTT